MAFSTAKDARLQTLTNVLVDKRSADKLHPYGRNQRKLKDVRSAVMRYQFAQEEPSPW